MSKLMEWLATPVLLFWQGGDAVDVDVRDMLGLLPPPAPSKKKNNP